MENYCYRTSSTGSYDLKKYYDILELNESASKQEIYTAYELKIAGIKKEYDDKQTEILNNHNEDEFEKYFTEIEGIQKELDDKTEQLITAKTEILKSIQNSTIIIDNKLVTLTNLCKNYKNYSKYFFDDTEYNNINTKCDKKEYNIIKTLGEGANNKVFLIQDNNNNKYAFRKLLQKVETDIDIINMELNGLFIQKYLATKCSENICKVFEFGILGDNPNIIQNNKEIEYTNPIYGILEVLDTDLEKYYEANILSIENYDTYISIFDEILSGLDCIHKQNFVHLDIKPANIGLKILDNNRVIVKIADFGTLTHIKNQTGHIYGSPLFLDAIYITTTKFNVRSDIYSFGMIIYFFVINAPFFNENNQLKDKWILFIDKLISPMTFAKINNILSKRKPKTINSLIRYIAIELQNILNISDIFDLKQEELYNKYNSFKIEDLKKELQELKIEDPENLKSIFGGIYYKRDKTHKKRSSHKRSRKTKRSRKYKRKTRAYHKRR